jgi:hypothetical protein
MSHESPVRFDGANPGSERLTLARHVASRHGTKQQVKGHDRVGSRHGASIHTELLSSLNPFHLPQSARLRTWTALTSLVARVGLERIRRRTFQLLS